MAADKTMAELTAATAFGAATDILEITLDPGGTPLSRKMTLASFCAGVIAPVVVTSASANALAVGRQGTTNPGLVVDASTASCITGIKITPAASGGGVAVVATGGTNEPLTIDAKGSGAVTIAGTSTGAVTITPATTITGALTATGGIAAADPIVVTDATAAALAVGRLGATTPALKIDASTATCITGIEVVAAATTGGVDLRAIGETNVNLRIDAKGSGTITLAGTSTGIVTITPATTVTGVLTSNGGITMGDAKNIITNSGTGTEIATATTQKIGFWGTTPVDQPVHIADATDAASAITQLNAVIASLEEVGLLAAS